VRTIPGSGLLVVNGEDEALGRVLARGVWTDVERFAAANAESPTEWSIADDGAVGLRGVAAGRLDFSQTGRHNRLNALAALAAARHVGVPVAEGLRALASFRGVKRRMELRGRVGGITVYDDFAHHPTAIATTVDGLRLAEPGGRILAVLEPRSNTMKLGTMKAALPRSLAQADCVFCYTAGLGWNAAEALAPLGTRAEIHEDLGALVAAVVAAARSGDHILVMSNGGFGGVHQRLLDALAAA